MAEKMNSRHDSEDEDEEEEDLEIAERLKLIREGKYKTEENSDQEEKLNQTTKRTKIDKNKFMRPT
jgi:hypothetical protein